MTLRRCVEIGHAKQMQYRPDAKRHAVEKRGDGWITYCTGKPATREFTGFLAAIACRRCLTEVGKRRGIEDIALL
jgi:hypothetical protein